jgi:hypothetical protein
MSKARKIFFTCLVVLVGTVVLVVAVSSIMFLYRNNHPRTYEFRQQSVSLEWAKSFAKDLGIDIKSLIENNAKLNREYSLSEKGIDKCFTSSDNGLVYLISVNDPLFSKTTTENFLPNGEFRRIVPVLITNENYLDCTSCHRHENLSEGDFIGSIVIRVNNVKE